MASLIPGYEYDIFISYRQKDNKHDGWVTDFVHNLKGELEAAIKEDISVYFDIDPQEGLLETHDVHSSLKDKLKCLVFIPIISRTYCDPGSFAWEHEFKAFIDQASNEDKGLKVKLSRGNFGTRVLPVIIHELDKKDIELCETALGGVLRGIDFIYKSPGVNRPLRSTEDKPHENLNKTIYLDQINKVANTVKDIISSLQLNGIEPEKEKPDRADRQADIIKSVKPGRSSGTFRFSRRQIITGSLIVLAVFAILKVSSIIFRQEGSEDTAEGILAKAIGYCDFYHRWDNYYGKIMLRTVREDGNHSDEIIEIQTKNNYYHRVYMENNEIRFTETIDNSKYYHQAEGKSNRKEAEVSKDSSLYSDMQFIKEHHYCHFGLLMELKKSGMVLQKKVEGLNFKGSKCLALTFINGTTRSDSGYFSQLNSLVVFLDPSDYSMRGVKYSGKINITIVFSGVLTVNDIRIPLCRTYFSNFDNSLKIIDVFSIAE